MLIKIYQILPIANIWSNFRDKKKKMDKRNSGLFPGSPVIKLEKLKKYEYILFLYKLKKCPKFVVRMCFGPKLNSKNHKMLSRNLHPFLKIVQIRKMFGSKRKVEQSCCSHFFFS